MIGLCVVLMIAAAALARARPAQVAPAVGLNKMDLFLQYLGTASGGDGSEAYRKVTRAMAKKAINDARQLGIPYFRVAVCGFAPSAYNQKGDLDLWRSNPASYWETMDQMFADLEANKLQIIPVFAWNWTQFPAMTHEITTDLIRNPQSASRRLLKNYIQAFIERYRGRPVVKFYELTNELNKNADRNVVRYFQNHPLKPAQQAVIDNFTSSQMIGFTSELGRFIAALDPDRQVSSGFTLPEPWADHLRRRSEFTGKADYTLDSPEEFGNYLRDIHKDLGIVTIHFYNGQKARLGRNNERFGRRGRNNADLLIDIDRITRAMGKQLYLGEFGDSDPTVKEDPRALFTQNVLKEIEMLRVPFSAAWVFEFYQTLHSVYDNKNTAYNLEPGYTDLILDKFKATNAALGNPIPQLAAQDKTQPQVVLTWPLEGRRVAPDQIVYAVASAAQRGVAKVEFAVDGKSAGSVNKPPFQLHIETGGWSPGAHQLSAIATDRASNTASTEITVQAAPRP